MKGSDSPANTYTAAHATIAREAAGSRDQTSLPTPPERRAAQMCAGIRTGNRKNPPPIEAMSSKVTMARAHLAIVSVDDRS
jgi:hypothetical protein